ncbi:MAG: VacB/RNase II family 3'-5' exoribonuclease [Alphaproteobacteria bacterium]
MGAPSRALTRGSERFESDAEDVIPTIFEVEITRISDDGEPFATATDADIARTYPNLLVDPANPAAMGDKLTVEVVGDDNGITLTRVVGKVQVERDYTFLAITEDGIAAMSSGFIKPFNRDLQATDFALRTGDDAIPAGSVVRVRPGSRSYNGPTPCELVEITAKSLQGMESLIAIDNHGIVVDFPPAALAECDNLLAFSKKELGQREDLRKLAIVTIDGADARDFDDAVWAEPWFESDGGYENGWHIIVAIADVAYYVRHNRALDDAAFLRGNSVYFPDRVVPMLPERLSNDLCSLRPHEDRPVLAVHLYIDGKGKLRKYVFSRAVIHSHARLTYEQAQEALDGNPDATTTPLLHGLGNLKKAADVLMAARAARNALDLDIAEPRVTMDATGTIQKVDARPRLFTHKLIEEMMILANVAAATALETRSQPCLYRIHPQPSLEKINTLHTLLKQHSLKIQGGSEPSQVDFGRLIDQTRQHPAKDMLMRNILQSQQQAKYDPENLGHFGLSLQRYAHFTSPIRRYSDLVVHRHLISALKLDGDGGHMTEARYLKKRADHLNITERRAQQAEWEARDRLIARFYGQHIGQKFEGTILNVLKFGCFVRVENVAEGLLPMRMLKDDYYIHNPKTLTLKGERTKKEFRVGQKLDVILYEASPLDGKLTFTLG